MSRRRVVLVVPEQQFIFHSRCRIWSGWTKIDGRGCGPCPSPARNSTRRSSTRWTPIPSAILVVAVIAPAKALGLTTPAEGIEREAQLAVLRDLGCDTAQGYFISHPLPAHGIDRAQPDRETVRA